MGKGNNGLLGLKRGPYKPQKIKSLRKLAKEAGELYYLTIKPCKHGHASKRLVSDGSCYACQPAKRKRINPDAKKRKLAATRNWQKANDEYRKEYRKKYQADPEKREIKRIAQLKRHALQMNAEGTFTKDDITQLKISQGYKCTICNCDLRETGYHIEHMIPLSRKGTNWPSNLQLLCPTDNLRKQALTDEEYRVKIGLAA